MADIIRFRAARFKALYDLLVGGSGAARLSNHDLPDHLTRDLGLPVSAPSARSPVQFDILIKSARL